MQTGMIRDKIEDFVTRLARTIQVNRIYGREHQLSLEAVDSLYKILSDLLVQKEDITIGIIGDEIAFEKEPLYELSARRKGFIEYLKASGIKKISFIRGVDRKELLEFAHFLTTRSESLDLSEDLQAVLEEKGIRHVILSDIGYQEKKKILPIPENRMREMVKRNYQTNIQMLTQTFKELKDNQQLNVQSARQIVESLIKNMLQNKNLMLVLTSLKTHDENTFMHGVNVAIFTLLQAEVLGLEEKYMTEMGMAALLHDVGKIAGGSSEQEAMSFWTQEAVPLETEEQKQARHDVAGAKILLETDGIPILPAIAAFEHSIKYDLSGIQRKLYGKKLNIVSMMIAISDYYDKLRRKPTYYETGGPEKAYEEMNKLSGTYFHPDLLKNFFSVIGIYPPGTLVELDSKEIALVIQASMLDLRRPQAEILYDSNGEKYKEPKIINLVEKDKKGQYKRSIVKSVAPLEKFEIPDKYA